LLPSDLFLVNEQTVWSVQNSKECLLNYRDDGGSKLLQNIGDRLPITQHHSQMMIFFINNIMKATNHICILSYGIVLSPAYFILFSFFKLFLLGCEAM